MGFAFCVPATHGCLATRNIGDVTMKHGCFTFVGEPVVFCCILLYLLVKEIKIGHPTAFT